jgi:hypothetical protein
MGSTPSKLASNTIADDEQMREKLIERLHALQLKHSTDVEGDYVYIGEKGCE